jgi:RimJ/RimL family protein N-acetyltransferase
MIEVKSAPNLWSLSGIAAQLPEEEQLLYTEMTGQEFDPDVVAAQLYLAGGVAWTFLDAGTQRLLAVGGYRQQRPGAWASWFMAHPDAWTKQYGRDLTRAVAETLQSMLSSPGVRRLETVTLASREKARRWYESIGLSYESTARKASASGLDLVTYVATRGE